MPVSGIPPPGSNAPTGTPAGTTPAPSQAESAPAPDFFTPGGGVVPGSQLGVLIPSPPVAAPQSGAPLIAVNPSVNNLIDPSVVPAPVPTTDTAGPAWNASLPPSNYQVDLTQFNGWEGGITRSLLPGGGTLERVAGQLRIRVPFGGDRQFGAVIGADGRFSGPMPGMPRAEIRGRVNGLSIVMERWEPVANGQMRQTAMWRTNFQSPYPPGFSGPLRSVDEPEPASRRGGLEAHVVGRIVSLCDETLQIYFSTGEIVPLPPRGAVQVTTREAESPHVVELRRSGLIDVILAA
jgi:hypothetical protein